MIKFNSKVCLQFNNPLIGQVFAYNDELIVQSALFLGAISTGETVIKNINITSGVLVTKKILQQLGVNFIIDNNICYICGIGNGGLSQPYDLLDCDNSFVIANILIGLLSSYNLSVFINGNKILRQCKLDQLLDKLQYVNFFDNNQKLPLLVQGCDITPGYIYNLDDIDYEIIKAALLFSAVNCLGETKLISCRKFDNNFINLLKNFGNVINIDQENDDMQMSLLGRQELNNCDIDFIGGMDEAIFLIIAAMVVKNSVVTINKVKLSANDKIIIDIFIKMGANIKLENNNSDYNLTVRHSQLKAIDINVKDIIHFPIIAFLVFTAEGKTKIKNYNLITNVEWKDFINYLIACGAKIDLVEDDLQIIGSESLLGGINCNLNNNYKMALNFILVASFCHNPININCDSKVLSLLLNFCDLMASLGMELKYQD